MRRNYVGLALISVVLLSCRIFSPVPTGETGNIKNVSADNAEMNAAIQKAQDTLPLFIQAFQVPTPTQEYFLIKAMFPYGDGNNAEHIWINDLSYEETQFVGTLGNEPVYVSNIKLGDRVTVKISDISDWMIIDDNRLLGGFTIHVLRNQMTESKRDQFDSEFGFIIPDEPSLP